MTNDEYRRKRDSLIPFAEYRADSVCGKDGDREWAIRWDLCFLGQMEYISRDEGLVKC